MIRSILIGLDTPDHVGALAEMGIRWARRFGATLVGLAIVDEPGIRAIEPLGPVGGTPGVNPVYYVGYENRMAEHQQKADRLLAEFAGRCSQAGVAHEEVSGVGSPHEVIEREAGACDLILMAMRSHFCFTAHEDEADDGLLKRVLKDTPRPVVVVPDGPAPEGPVAIAYDGSLQAERVLAALEFDRPRRGGTGPRPQRRHRSRRGHPPRRARPPFPRPAPGRGGGPSVGVRGAGRRHPRGGPALGAGLLVMGAYGQPVLREFFLGSVTRSILAACPIPMFLYH